MGQKMSHKFDVKNKKICSKHFTAEDYQDAMQARLMGTFSRKLKKSAIPSLYLLPPASENIPKNTERTKRMQKKERKVLVETLTGNAENTNPFIEPHTITSGEVVETVIEKTIV